MPGAAHGRPTTGTCVAAALLIVHLVLADERRPELVLAILAGALGLTIDSLNLHFGIVRFRPEQTWLGGALAPGWIVLLWMQFATLFRFSPSWLSGRPVLAALFGAVGGPLAFWSGARLGAAALSPRVATSLSVLAAIWAIALPLGLAAARRVGPEPAHYRTGAG